MSIYDDINKNLDKLDNQIIKQSVEFLINKIAESSTDEEADIAKTALLVYLHKAAPELIKANSAIETALHKSDVSSVDAEDMIKKALSSSGIYYFGPLPTDLSKHNTKWGRVGDPKAPGDKLYPKHDSPPHVEIGGVPPGAKLPTQWSHGIRPGRREMIGYLRDLQSIMPDLGFGKRMELMGMSQVELKNLIDSKLPGFLDNYHRGRGRATNTRSVDRLNNLMDYFNNNKGNIPGESKDSAKKKIRSRLDAINEPDTRVSAGTPQTGYDSTGDGEADFNTPRKKVPSLEPTKGGATPKPSKKPAKKPKISDKELKRNAEEAKRIAREKATSERAAVPAAERAAARERMLAQQKSPEEMAAARKAKRAEAARRRKEQRAQEQQSTTQPKPEQPVSGWDDVDAVAQRIYEDILSQIEEVNAGDREADNVGYTASGDTLDKAPYTSGYMVSLKGMESKPEELTPESIAAYLRKYSENVKNDNFGVWYDPSDGKIYLDVSRHFKLRNAAKKFGKENDQRAIYDIKNEKSLDISAKPKSETKTPKEEAPSQPQTAEVKTKPGEETAGQKREKEAEQVRQETQAAINAEESPAQETSSKTRHKVRLSAKVAEDLREILDRALEDPESLQDNGEEFVSQINEAQNALKETNNPEMSADALYNLADRALDKADDELGQYNFLDRSNPDVLDSINKAKRLKNFAAKIFNDKSIPSPQWWIDSKKEMAALNRHQAIYMSALARGETPERANEIADNAVKPKSTQPQAAEVKTRPGEKTAGQKRVQEAERVRRKTRAAINAEKTESTTKSASDTSLSKSLDKVNSLLSKLSELRERDY